MTSAYAKTMPISADASTYEVHRHIIAFLYLNARDLNTMYLLLPDRSHSYGMGETNRLKYPEQISTLCSLTI